MIATQVPDAQMYSDVSSHSVVDVEPEQQELYEIGHAMIQMHLPLVQAMARDFHRRCSVDIAYDDLVSVGVHALTEALADYSSSEHRSFSQFCLSYIKEALIDAVRYASWMSHCLEKTAFHPMTVS